MPMNAVLLGVLLIGAPLVMMVRLLLQDQLTLELRERGEHARGEAVRVRTSWMNRKYRVVESAGRLGGPRQVQGAPARVRGLGQAADLRRPLNRTDAY
ncbi:hypothetical protein [Corallococcus sp. AS-1-12]|uniref:hypothetical protein n=1 Tax=Corallococcus sp. AS-1-12 TaxID=2874598 RepID=UPI001CBBADFB|nr:hypothetical protein [Corallococcus sp. AS-1-12]MBZ4333942.1 hypothetical protein [Corallococcus sp. AS-1-12]